MLRYAAASIHLYNVNMLFMLIYLYILFSYTRLLVVYGNNTISFTNFSKPTPHFDIPLMELFLRSPSMTFQCTGALWKITDGSCQATVGDGENPKSRTTRTNNINDMYYMH